MSYVVVDAGRAIAAFTGGSLLYGTVGRTDLISEEATNELTRAQYRSVRHLADQLRVRWRPSHPRLRQLLLLDGVERLGREHTADERRTNIALTVGDEDRFVEEPSPA